MKNLGKPKGINYSIILLMIIVNAHPQTFFNTSALYILRETPQMSNEMWFFGNDILLKNDDYINNANEFNGDELTRTYYNSNCNFPTTIDFTGTNNDYLNFGDKHGMDALVPFSFEAWVLQHPGVSGARTILSKGDAKEGSMRGYQLFLNNGFPNFTWYTNSGEILVNIASPVALIPGKWHHVAVTYNGNFVKIYIDGIDVVQSGASFTSLATGNEPFIIGAYFDSSSPSVPKNNFNGFIDEVRIWNTALSVKQVREMMNQEIEVYSLAIRGKKIPINISENLLWSNLKGYYTFNDNTATDQSDYGNNGTIMNMCSNQPQTAPLPYTTNSSISNDWDNSSIWTYGNTYWQIPNSRGIDGTSFIDWNIIEMNHNIDSQRNLVLLALIVSPQATLNVMNDSKVEISKYLKLNGRIDLVGKSQLIQTTNCILDATSNGCLERDQQGQSNRFNYNYWSSPVSTINNITNNHGFTIAEVMKDGTNPNNIQNINWTTSINGSPTSPITLSNYWIFKYQNITNNYANWISVGESGLLLAGQGYTLKGCGALANNQNYTFIGKPNNGLITAVVSPHNINLCGNPYPSALDANAFISANSSSITGTLYFWEHYRTNSSHNTIQYQGGYATRTLVGGTPPVAPTLISGLGSSSRIPGRFIPVGQGFIVIGSASGGTITFDNNQRIFIKENNVNSNSLFKETNGSDIQLKTELNNIEDSFTQEQFMKLRLGFVSGNNYHKQILLGFMNQYATSQYDNGYDGISIESPTNDIYFINGTYKLNIQGEGYFNSNSIYPLGVKTEYNGIVKFIIDEKENFDENQDIFIYDSSTGIYHNIKNSDIQIFLPAGLYENRFSLRFSNHTALGESQNNISKGISINFTHNDGLIIITNNLQDTLIKSVMVYNLLGQLVKSYFINEQLTTSIQLPFTSTNSGVYIVKVFTNKGELSKKVISK